MLCIKLFRGELQSEIVHDFVLPPSTLHILGVCVQRVHFSGLLKIYKTATHSSRSFSSIFGSIFFILYFLFFCIFIFMPLQLYEDNWSAEILKCNPCQKWRINTPNSKQVSCLFVWGYWWYFNVRVITFYFAWESNDTFFSGQLTTMGIGN